MAVIYVKEQGTLIRKNGGSDRGEQKCSASDGIPGL